MYTFTCLLIGWLSLGAAVPLSEKQLQVALSLPDAPKAIVSTTSQELLNSGPVDTAAHTPDALLVANQPPSKAHEGTVTVMDNVDGILEAEDKDSREGAQGGEFLLQTLSRVLHGRSLATRNACFCAGGNLCCGVTNGLECGFGTC